MVRAFQTVGIFAATLLATGCLQEPEKAEPTGGPKKDPIVVNPGDTAKGTARKTLPFPISPVFVPDGLMGDYDLDGFHIDPLTWEVKVTAGVGTKGFSGVAWLNNQNWSDFAAAVVIDSGATRFTFEAKGSVGGETIKAGLGGATTPRTPVTLTDAWEAYEAPIPPGMAYSPALVLFVTVVEGNKTPVTWHVRNVVLK